MLGKSSYRVGVYDIMGRDDMKLPEEETTIAEVLRDVGYSTFHGGKWHMNPHDIDPQVAAKHHIHEGGIRVPGFAVWPGKIKPGQRNQTPIHAWDALPTFAEAAGVELTVKCDGQSFLPPTRGQALHRKTPLYWSWFNARGGVNYAIRNGNWKLLAIAEPRLEGRKVVQHIKQAGFSGYELYNLSDDPNENNDLAASHPKELERMKKKFLPLHKDIVSEGPMLRMKGDKHS